MKTRKLAGLALLVSLTMIGAAAAQAPRTVTFAITPSPDTPQANLAISAGLWKELNLEVKTVSFPTGREAFEALLGGQVDFAAMAEFPAVTGALRNQKFGVIVDMSRYTGNRLIATAKKGDVKSLADLAGRKIGTTLGTNVDFFTDIMLAKAGVKAEVVNAGPSDLVPALMRGDIDGAVMFPSFYAAAKKTLGDQYREIISSDYYLHFIVCASGDVEKNPELVRKFLAGLVKADELVAKDPGPAQEATVKMMNGMTDIGTLRTMSKDYEYRLTLDSSLLDLMVAEGAWILKRGLIKGEAAGPATYRAYIHDAALKSVAPDRIKLP